MQEAAEGSAANAVILGRVGLSRRNLNPRTTTMTDDKIALRAFPEKGSDATFPRDLTTQSSQGDDRLCRGAPDAAGTEIICGADPGERSAGRTNQCRGYRERDWETRAGTVELRIPPRHAST